MTNVPGDIWAALWIILGAAGAFLARQFWPYLSSLWSQDAESRRKQAEQRASLAVDEEEHRQNADNEVRHAYFMLGQSLLAEQRRANEQIVERIQHSLDAQNNISERQTVVLDGIMRAQIAAEYREQERDRALRAIVEHMQRQTTIWSTFAPQIFGQSDMIRPWERREGERE